MRDAYYIALKQLKMGILIAPLYLIRFCQSLPEEKSNQIHVGKA